MLVEEKDFHEWFLLLFNLNLKKIETELDIYLLNWKSADLPDEYFTVRTIKAR